MSKRNSKKSKKNKKSEINEFPEDFAYFRPQQKVNEPLTPQNEKQKKYINCVKSNTITYATGSAGTGKTYIAGCLACTALHNKQVERIIITRPAVEAGESLGFLPGELDEKFDPYLQPFRAVLEERLGHGTVEYMLKNKVIEAIPLGYLRGRTFKNAFVILDEAQNTTPTQMKMFLTRIGYNCKVIVNGDGSQKDIKDKSGLDDAVRRTTWIPGVAHVHFDRNDVVRSGIVSDIIQAYDEPLPTSGMTGYYE